VAEVCDTSTELVQATVFEAVPEVTVTVAVLEPLVE
jgi:hypothetical protein